MEQDEHSESGAETQPEIGETGGEAAEGDIPVKEIHLPQRRVPPPQEDPRSPRFATVFLLLARLLKGMLVVTVGPGVVSRRLAVLIIGAQLVLLLLAGVHIRNQDAEIASLEATASYVPSATPSPVVTPTLFVLPGACTARVEVLGAASRREPDAQAAEVETLYEGQTVAVISLQMVGDVRWLNIYSRYNDFSSQGWLPEGWVTIIGGCPLLQRTRQP